MNKLLFLNKNRTKNEALGAHLAQLTTHPLPVSLESPRRVRVGGQLLRCEEGKVVNKIRRERRIREEEGKENTKIEWIRRSFPYEK